MLIDCFYLLEHSEEHFSAEMAEGRSLVGVDGERVRPDLYVLVAQRLRVDHQLHQRVLLDVGHRVDHLKQKRNRTLKVMVLQQQRKPR